MNLDNFILISKSKIFNNNAYVNEKGFKSLYVRFGKRYINQIWHDNVLDIANVETICKGKGTFTKLIKKIRSRYPETIIYVESVINPRLPNHLKSLGFLKIDNGYSEDAMVPSSFYLPIGIIYE